MWPFERDGRNYLYFKKDLIKEKIKERKEKRPQKKERDHCILVEKPT